MNHLKIILYAGSFFFLQHAAAQYAYQKAEVYFLKSDFTAAKDINDATYILQVVKYNDTTYTCRYYNKFGPILKQETFFDAGLTVPNGPFAWYDTRGNIDSMATVYKGRKTTFSSYDDDLKTKLSIDFRNGNVFEKRDYILNTCTDSIGNITSLADKQKAQHDKFVADSIAGETKAAYFGNEETKDWQKYISKHLIVPDRFENVMQEGNYEVIVSFLIKEDGSVSDVYLLRSCEWSADLEVFKVFENSPQWKPAMFSGKNVIYREKQSFSFSKP
jgi:hypothetical protein